MKVKNVWEPIRERLNTEHDKFDILACSDVIEQVPALQEYVKEGEKIVKTFPEFTQDVFNAMFKLDPKMIEEAPKGTELNRKELAYFLDSADYKQLRDSTFLDEVGSALAMRGFLPEYIERLKQDEDLQKSAQASNDALEDGSEESQKNAQQMADQAGGAMRRAINKAIAKGMQEAEDGKEALDAMGWGTESEALRAMSLNQKLKMVDNLKQYKRKVDLIGRMRHIAQSSRTTKIDYQRVELHSVTIGNDIGRLLPSELALFKTKARVDQLRKLAERQMLQYSLKHNEQQGKGNIIVLRDSSGSMSDRYDEDGNRDEYAAAITLGLAEIAKSDKRNFVWGLFDTQIGLTRQFPKGQYTPEQAMEIMTTSLGGGTEYERPLKWAMKQVEENDVAENADIVVITDGYCDVSNEFKKNLMEWKKKTGTKVFVLVVGANPHNMDWADGVWDSFTGDDIEQVYSSI